MKAILRLAVLGAGGLPNPPKMTTLTRKFGNISDGPLKAITYVSPIQSDWNDRSKDEPKRTLEKLLWVNYTLEYKKVGKEIKKEELDVAKVYLQKLTKIKMSDLKDVQAELLKKKDQGTKNHVANIKDDLKNLALVLKVWPGIVKDVMAYNKFFAASRQGRGEAIGRIKNEVIQAAKQLGCTVAMEKNPTEYEKEQYLTVNSADSTIKIQFRDLNPDDDDMSSGSTYFKKTAEDKGWYSFDRRGFEDSFYYNDDTNIANLIKEQIEKCKKSQERQKNTQPYNFGPRTTERTPEEFQKLVQQLKQGQSVQLTPAGMGTGYRFSVKRGSYSKPASEMITKAVGKQVWFEEFDYD